MGCPVLPSVATRSARGCMEEHFALALVSVTDLIRLHSVGRFVGSMFGSALVGAFLDWLPLPQTCR